MKMMGHPKNASSKTMNWTTFIINHPSLTFLKTHFDFKNVLT
jgi:hypothetical protein